MNRVWGVRVACQDNTRVHTNLSRFHDLCDYSLFDEQMALAGERMRAWAGERARSREGEKVNE